MIIKLHSLSRFFSTSILSFGIIATQSISGDEITWIAEDSNDNMNTPSNWSSDSIPSSFDDVFFDSSIVNINTTPVEETVDFSVSAFQFPFLASPFVFNFNNYGLTFSGPGITGDQTNATINFTNTDNSSSITNQLTFNNSISPNNAYSGNAIFNLTNSATLTGSVANVSVSSIDMQIQSLSPFFMAGYGSIAAINEASDSSSGLGNNYAAYANVGQLQFADNLTLDDHASISLTNTGNYSGNNSTSGNFIGITQYYQLNVDETFLAGDHFNLTATNSGTNGSSGAGSNYIGCIRTGPQTTFNGAFTIGKHGTLTLSNSGTNSCSSTFSDVVGYIVEQQFHVVEEFIADDYLNLTVSNIGIDNSTGSGGHTVGSLDSFSSYGNQIQFDNTCSIGTNSTISASNSGTYTGINTSTGCYVGTISLYQTYFNDAFLADDAFTLTLSNIGIDSSNGVGNNAVGTISSAQAIFNSSCTLGENATITAYNTANYSGSNSASYNNVGSVGGYQIIFMDTFQADDSFLLSVSNSGTNSGTGVPANFIGCVTGAGTQVHFNDSCIVENNASITVTNSATNLSHSANYVNLGSYLNNGQQFYIADLFQAGNDLNITVQNTALDESIGTGEQSFIASILGSPHASQIQFDAGCTIQDNTTISIINQGTYSGTNTVSGNNVGILSGNQLYVTSAFNAGNDLNLSASNTGIDSAIGLGNDSVGTISSGPQIQFNSTCTVKNNATISANNSGEYTGSNSTNANSIGLVQGGQILFNSSFQADNGLDLSALNVGADSSSGIGNNLIGFFRDDQLRFSGTAIIADNATISLSNRGSSTSTDVNNIDNFIGVIGNSGNSNQITTAYNFAAGNYFTLTVENMGNSSSHGTGSQVGVLAYQCSLNASFSTGANATIQVSNTGVVSSIGNTNTVGCAGDGQFTIGGNFNAGNSLILTVTNTGTDNTTGAVNNDVGFTYGPQILVNGTFTVGDDAIITMSNTGINNNSASFGLTGVLFNQNQFSSLGAFSSGKNLQLSAINDAQGISSIGHIGECLNQLEFQSTCSLDDGSFISASNEGFGTVTGSQIIFAQGFTITSGRSTIQASNSSLGTVVNPNILVEGTSTGGDVNIILTNALLSINNSSPTIFTIGELNGDSLSTVQSNADLIIETDSGVAAIFSGVIQNYPSTISSLVKTGLGTQTLSGINTFTGNTAIEGGTLILNGTLAGDVNQASSGTLGGIGTILGHLTDNGTIAPGNSIGTLNVGTYTKNGGTYDVEVNGEGQSDLIEVTGNATITSGTVLVSSIDGTYKFQSPYTILKAANVTGTYSGTSTVSSMIISSLTYDSQEVYLTLASNISAATVTYNEQVVAFGLDSIINPNAVQSTLLNEIVSLSIPRAQSALDSVSGWQYTNDFFVAETINKEFINRLYDPIRGIVTLQNKSDCCTNLSSNQCCNDYTTWIEAGGTHTQLSGNENAFSIVLNGWEVTAGIQKTFLCNWTIGLGGSFEHDYINYKHQGGSSHSNTGLVGLYALYRPSYFYAFVDFAYGYSWNSMNRQIHIGSINYTAHSSPQISQFSFYGELGVDLPISAFLIQPFVAVGSGSYSHNNVNETYAGGWGLQVKGENCGLASSRLGTHLTTNKFPGKVSMSLDLAWDKNYTNNTNTINEQFAQFGEEFSIKGVNLGSNSFDYALTITKCVNKHLKMYIKGSGEIWNKAYQCNGILGAELSW